MSFHLQYTLPLISQQEGGKFQDHQTLGNVIGHTDSLIIAQAAQDFNGVSVVVTPDSQTANRLEKASSSLVPCLFLFLQTGKPYLTITFLRIKILSLRAFPHYFSYNKAINKFSCCQLTPCYRNCVRQIILPIMCC